MAKMSAALAAMEEHDAKVIEQQRSIRDIEKRAWQAQNAREQLTNIIGPSGAWAQHENAVRRELENRGVILYDRAAHNDVLKNLTPDLRAQHEEAVRQVASALKNIAEHYREAGLATRWENVDRDDYFERKHSQASEARVRYDLAVELIDEMMADGAATDETLWGLLATAHGSPVLCLIDMILGDLWKNDLSRPVPAAITAPAGPSARTHSDDSKGQQTEILQHPDGPEEGRWLWWKGKRYDLPAGVTYRLIAYMWARETGNYDDMMDGNVWDDAVEPQTVRSALSDASNALPTGFPWRSSADSVKRQVVKKTKKPKQDTAA